MPNLMYCSLIMQGEKSDIDHVKKEIAGLDEENRIRPIDFNKILPMPPELNVSHIEEVKTLCQQKYIKQSTDKHLEIFLKAEGSDSYQSNLLLVEKYYENFKQFGYMTWYDWCIEKWGAKWNAIYDEFQEKNHNPNVIHFITAYHPPIPIMNALACKYPKVDFSLEYFDECDYDCENLTTINFKLGEPKT